MCLKESLSHYKLILQAILSLTVISNCFSVSSNFDTVFLADFTKFCSIFLGYRIGNLMRIPKMCLKLLFSHSKWVFSAILYLTVLSHCVSVSLNFKSAFLLDCTKLCSVFKVVQ